MKKSDLPMYMKKLILFLTALAGIVACSDRHYWKGADIGWATEYEADGQYFYNKDGERRECSELMKELGLDALRFRVWVDPSKHGNWNGREDLLVKASRARDLGMAIMIDFHYSDFWADPKKQNIPASWSGKSYEEIRELLAEHTRDVLQMLKDNGIKPRWVQVGNETSNGFLWTVRGDQWGDPVPDSLGRVTILESVGHLRNNPQQYAGLFAAGYDAVKSVFPKAEVIVHLDNGFDQALYDSNLDTLAKYGARWDMIGMSLYPYWALDSGLETDEEEAITHCIENINHVWEKYRTPVMLVETGFEVDESRPEVMEKGRDQLRRIIRESRATGHCRGIFYWEPECRPDRYKLGAFGSDGRPTAIMDGFDE
ncbi:MAG: glycosyl hydrolase 53 family protein [Candidatus Cryptobacteroides sp.]|nr:glycosyl hydrolase 53 family protein [Candidatus Cryptobacteroides sp.]